MIRIKVLGSLESEESEVRRPCPLNVIFAIFVRYLQQLRGLMGKQETWAISSLSAIGSKRSE